MKKSKNSLTINYKHEENSKAFEQGLDFLSKDLRQNWRKYKKIKKAKKDN